MKHKTSILIVEDEGIIAEHLKLMLNAEGFLNISMAHDKERALSIIPEFNPGLILLDIRMKNQFDGIEIAQSDCVKDKIPFIYITAHSDAHILGKALDTKPSGYITKPFNQASVYAAINIALSKTTEHEIETIAVKDGFDILRIALKSILYVESEGNYIDIYTDDGKKSIRHSLEWFLQNVPVKSFMRVHRSYVINLSRVSRISGANVIIEQYPVPVSRKLMAELKSVIKS